MTYKEYTRLRDLEDKDSKQEVQKVLDFLESQEGSTTLSEIAKELNIPILLLEDIIELLILKGWLILPDGDDE